MGGKKSFVFACLAIFSSTLFGEIDRCNGNDSYFWQHYAQAKDPETFNLRWAECEMKLGKTDAAIAAYERVLYYNDENEEALQALIGLYKKSGMYYEIGDMLNAADNRRLAPSQRQIVSSLMGEGQNDLLSMKFSADLKTGYDNNVNRSLFSARNGPVTVPKKIDSFFHLTDVRMNLVHELEEIGGFSFQANAEFFWKDNYNAHFYDIATGSFDAGIGYSAQRYSIYLPLVYEKTHYLNTNLYEEFGIKPRFTYLIGDDLLLNLGGKYLRHHYTDGISSDGDRTIRGANIGLYKFFGDDYIYSDIEYTDADARSSNPLPASDYTYWTFRIGGSYEIYRGIISKLDYRYGHGKYDNFPITFQKRKDIFNEIHIGLEKEIMPRLAVTADYLYSDNDSNNNIQSYSKQIVSVGIKYTY